MEQNPNKIRALLIDKSELIIAEELTDEVHGKTSHADCIWLKAPAFVYHERAVGGSLGFMLTPWLPNELLTNLVIELDTRKIMGEVQPSLALLSIYKAWSTIEQEKLQEFSADFDAQVTSIETYIKDRFANTKAAHAKRPITAANTAHLSNAIYNLFDSDTNWGDPNVTQ